MKTGVLLIPLLLFGHSSFADEADVIDAKATKTAKNVYRFSVTLKHGDTGWQHYANKWEVLSPSGEVLGTRVLYHPHVNEQPFTRELSGVSVPENLTQVIIRAHDSVHGTGGREILLQLPKN